MSTQTRAELALIWAREPLDNFFKEKPLNRRQGIYFLKFKFGLFKKQATAIYEAYTQ